MGDDELLGAYLATEWTLWAGAGPLSVRIGVPAPLPAADLPVAIITAYNPASLRCSPMENRTANARLEQHLQETGSRYLRALAHGTGPEATAWDEPGFAALAVDQERIIALGRDFGQNAIVWAAPDAPAVLIATRPGFCGRSVGETLEPFTDFP